MSTKPLKRKRKVDFLHIFIGRHYTWPLYICLVNKLIPFFVTPGLYNISPQLLKCSHHSSPRCKPYPTTHTKPHNCLNANVPGKNTKGIWYKFNRDKHKTARHQVLASLLKFNK